MWNACTLNIGHAAGELIGNNQELLGTRLTSQEQGDALSLEARHKRPLLSLGRQTTARPAPYASNIFVRIPCILFRR